MKKNETIENNEELLFLLYKSCNLIALLGDFAYEQLRDNGSMSTAAKLRNSIKNYREDVERLVKPLAFKEEDAKKE